MNLKKYILVGLVAVLGLSSCGKFEKFRKSADLPTKYKAAVNYYKKKDFAKAGILFDEIMPLMKGDSTQELATFYQAYCDFNLGSYTLASSHFKKFAEVFSRSEFAEEAIYMSAFSLYKDSPNFNLDQKGTLAAINEIQDNPQSIGIVHGAIPILDGTVDHASERQRFNLHPWTQVIDVTMFVFARTIAERVECRVGQHALLARFRG